MLDSDVWFDVYYMYAIDPSSIGIPTPLGHPRCVRYTKNGHLQACVICVLGLTGLGALRDLCTFIGQLFALRTNLVFIRFCFILRNFYQLVNFLEPPSLNRC